ncbi:MAG: hypothetical protein HYW10_05165, partial [Candidatus Omnitrophica bacterium]|nr:hypothetical protein [Candidatus Omnitrophota bacterium]
DDDGQHFYGRFPRVKAELQDRYAQAYKARMVAALEDVWKTSGTQDVGTLRSRWLSVLKGYDAQAVEGALTQAKAANRDALYRVLRQALEDYEAPALSVAQIIDFIKFGRGSRRLAGEQLLPTLKPPKEALAKPEALKQWEEAQRFRDENTPQTSQRWETATDRKQEILWIEGIRADDAGLLKLAGVLRSIEKTAQGKDLAMLRQELRTALEGFSAGPYSALDGLRHHLLSDLLGLKATTTQELVDRLTGHLTEEFTKGVEGLKDQIVLDSDALFLGANEMPRQGYRKDDLTAKQVREMYLQAIYMTYNKDPRGVPKRLQLGDMGNLLDRMEKLGLPKEERGKFLKHEALVRQDYHLVMVESARQAFLAFIENPEEDAGFIRRSLQRLGLTSRQFPRPSPERIKAILERIERDLPPINEAETQGFIARRHELGQGEAWMREWFEDAGKVQAAHLLATDRFHDPDRLESTIKQIRGARERIDDNAQFKMVRRFRSIYQEDVAFANLRDRAELLRALLSKGKVAFKAVLSPEQQQRFLAELEALRGRLEQAQVTDERTGKPRPLSQGEIGAKMRELIERVGAITTGSFVDLVAQAIETTTPDVPNLLDAIDPALVGPDGLEAAILPKQVSALANEPARLKERERLNHVRQNEERILRPVREGLKEQRDLERQALHKTLQTPQGWAQAEREIQVKVYNASGKTPISLLNEPDGKGILSYLVGKRLELGLTVEEVSERFIFLYRRAAEVYRNAYGRPELKPGEQLIIFALVRPIFEKWGVVALSQDQRAALEEALKRPLEKGGVGYGIEEGINREFRKLTRELILAQHLQRQFDRIGKPLPHDEARQMAANAFSAGLTEADLTAWIDVALKVKALITQRLGLSVIEGTLDPAQVDLDAILYQVDSWLRLGLIPAPPVRVFTEAEYLEAVDKALARLSSTSPMAARLREHREWLAKRLHERKLSPVTLRLLIDQAHRVKAWHETTRAKDA